MNPLLAPYVELLSRYREKVNLTGARDKNDIAAIAEDSLITLDKGIKVLDLGSGGGLPGAPLKLHNPEISISFMDKNRKKMNILRQMLLTLGIEFDEIYTGKAETFHVALAEKFDAVVSRGVGDTDFVLGLARPFLKKGGVIYLWKPKGYTPHEDLKIMCISLDIKIFEKKECDIIALKF